MRLGVMMAGLDTGSWPTWLAGNYSVQRFALGRLVLGGLPLRIGPRFLQRRTITRKP